MRSPRANVRPACGRRCTPGSWTPRLRPSRSDTSCAIQFSVATTTGVDTVDCPAQSSRTTSRPRPLLASSRRSRFRCSRITGDRRHGPGRDATPSNRSAEASRAPRGHVNDVSAGIAPGSCRTTPARGRPRRLQGSHRDAPRTIAERILVPAPVAPPSRGSLPALDPALQRSLGFPPVRLAASPWASLACVFRRSLEVRRALVSELNTGCTARHARSMGIREIQTFSPPFFRSSPSAAAAIPSSSPW